MHLMLLHPKEHQRKLQQTGGEPTELHKFKCKHYHWMGPHANCCVPIQPQSAHVKEIIRLMLRGTTAVPSTSKR